ncbi:uncharacterized protein LOC128388995 isoform X3 [Panonychus citri]|uniref:uncharacterized protein LOC128388995 isoform X3 n=1 Tax=Panonychus citri TaxID=50023 RepID=UPI002307AE2F|nr:uncharacterized protein LOC128388995 isoform X3 [Panonychus citri]
MSFNDLPDNCLWKIFENVHEAKDLIGLSKVCSRWSDLITPRLNQVKYLRLINDQNDYIDKDSLCINYRTDWKDYNLMESFPNLKIIEISLPDHLTFGNFNKNPKIKGLIDNCISIEEDFKFENIEMYSSGCFDLDYTKVFRPDQLKQVYWHCYDLNLPSFIDYFPNLKRLHLELYGEDQVSYNGPNLSSLKILEFSSDLVAGFHFMDFCPSLESAFIGDWAEDIFVNESIKNYNLRDLVFDNDTDFSWSLLQRLLSKFPNLHHLGIRNMNEINDSNLEELVKLLPKLKILDLRTCVNVTEKSADFLSKFCVENRSIVIYYDCENEPTEWPKLVNTCEPICYGFDFMKHCFYKDFNHLPYLIDE